MTSSAPCATPVEAHDSTLMTVQEVNAAVVTLTVDPGIAVPPGTLVTFTAVTAGTVVEYIWQLNGTIIPGAASASYSAVFAHNDSIICIAMVSDRCLLPGSAGVRISTENTKTENLIDKYNEIKAIPNLSNGAFHIVGIVNNESQIDVDLFDLTGQLVYHKIVQIKNGYLNAQIYVPTIPSGIYILQAGIYIIRVLVVNE